jgi:predicted nucleic acid-binding protein
VCWKFCHCAPKPTTTTTASATHLERNGTPVGENDLLIVGQTLTEGLVLVTANTNEFSRVEGLVLENWLLPS